METKTVMNASDFVKFPSTPHLGISESQDIRSDKCLSLQERELFLSKKIIIEEKIDGANLGISFDKQGNIIVQNRGSILTKPYSGQWKKLQTWLEIKQDCLFDMLGDHLILFGEWCYAKHSIGYDCLPDWFVAFDIFDKAEKKFYSVRRRNALLEENDIPTVPFVKEGFFTYVDLLNLSFTSKFGSDLAEGIYLRVDNQFWLIERAKLVRSTFHQAIEAHWSKSRIIPNKLADKNG